MRLNDEWSGTSSSKESRQNQRYRILARFVRRTSGQPDDRPVIADYDALPFFGGIEMMPRRRLLRRVTLSLAARLSNHTQHVHRRHGSHGETPNKGRRSAIATVSAFLRVPTITDLLSQGVPLGDVQHLAGHADPLTTRLYDRRHRQVTRNIVERTSI